MMGSRKLLQGLALAAVVALPSTLVSAYAAGPRVTLVPRRAQPSLSVPPRAMSAPNRSARSPGGFVSRAVALSGGGGGAGGDSTTVTTTTLGSLAAAWGALGVMYILLNPIKRLLPMALKPFTSPGDLQWWGWAAYVGWAVVMGYAEGYKAFQLKFSPMVVRRAMTLDVPPSERPHGWWAHALFAPLYSMGLFHASKKRLIVSWSFVIGVASIVAAVKRLPYPWRSVIDGGVVLGLSWGATAVLVNYLRALAGDPPAIDPQMPHDHDA